MPELSIRGGGRRFGCFQELYIAKEGGGIQSSYDRHPNQKLSALCLATKV
jgi:hypothetical protein